MLSGALKRRVEIEALAPRPLVAAVTATVSHANDLLADGRASVVTAEAGAEFAEPAFLRGTASEAQPTPVESVQRDLAGGAGEGAIAPVRDRQRQETLDRAATAARQLHEQLSPPTPTPVDTAQAPAPVSAPTADSEAPAESKRPDRSAGVSTAAEGDSAPAAASTDAAEAPADVPLLMPEPPTGPSPATKARIGGVRGRAGGSAAAHQTLPPGKEQVGDARAAVTPPTAEEAAEAQAKLIALVQAAPSPEIVALCERIKQVIRDKRPPDEDALMQAEPAKEALDAGNQLNGTINSETKKVQDNYAGVNAQPAVQPGAPGAPIPPQPEVAATAPINATAAVPDAVPDGNVSLDADAAASRQKAVDAGMETEPAQLVQSGPIAEARAAQGELDQTAQEDPAKVLERQKQTLGTAEGDMAQLQARALGALTVSRTKTANDNAKQQGTMVGSEEEMRTQAGAEATRIFEGAQKEVNDQLKDLPAKAMAEWDAAKDVLVAQFKADLAPVQKRVDERHAGGTGFVVGIWDAITGLPDWAEEGYTKAETDFGDGVIAKLTAISTKVNAVIAACDLLIKTAREDIKGVFAKLPGTLGEWAAEQQRKFDGDLDQLHAKAIKTRDSFNKDLVNASSAAVDEVRTEIAELRKKASGLIGRIADAVGRFIDDPVKFIIEGLLELLGIPPAAFWAVVAKIKQVVSDIADDPISFANNLLTGLGEGFGRFFDNFGTHILRGFLGWLLGDLKDVAVPKDASLKSIITFFLQLMGITWPNIRKILVEKIGAKNVALIEKAYSVVALLVEQGPEGIFEMIRQQLDPQAIVDQVVAMAVDYMVTAIAKQVAVRIALLFNPAGAILQALEAIYRVLKWVFQNAARIFTLIQTIVNGLADIIAGNISGFAKAVETGLEMLIAPVLGFIADYFSLGDLPAIVADKIKSMRKWILGIIAKVIDWLIAKGKALLAAVGLGGKKKEDKKKGKDGFDGQIGDVVHWTAEEERHELWIEETGAQPEVMMASGRKGPVREKLAEYEPQVANIKVKDRKARATKAIGDAREALGKTYAAAKETKAERDKAEGKPEQVKAKDDETESWEELLWPQLQTIQIALHPAMIPPTKVAGGGPQASTVIADPLSKKGSRGSGPRGKLRGWEHVLVIDHELLNPAKGHWGPAYWVAAHLVSEELHGPGDPWNTTPMLKVDNKNMELTIEAAAKEKIAEDEVLYYIASVDYYSGPILEDFPSGISIQWGTLRAKGKEWERGEELKPYSRALEQPPLDPNYVPNINNIRREGLLKRGVPQRFAMAMDDERRAGGPFRDLGSFEDRMASLYANKIKSSDFKLQEGIEVIIWLVENKKLQFGKQ